MPRENGPIRLWAVNHHRDAVRQVQFAAQPELAALCVPVKIIMIFKDEDRTSGVRLPIEPSSGEAADATTDNERIMVFSRARQGARRRIAIADGMDRLKGATVAAAPVGDQ